MAVPRSPTMLRLMLKYGSCGCRGLGNTSNGLKAAELSVKDMSAEEAATASGKDLTNQPWAIFQIYVLAITVATIAVTLTAIY